MLAPAAQEYFATATFEYPVVEGIATLPELLPVDSLARLQPPVDLDGLGDLEETLALLREAGVL
jgi:iron(III) transport system substrate-binding protein